MGKPSDKAKLCVLGPREVPTAEVASSSECTCDAGVESHPCPFDEEILGDCESECNCCGFCTSMCANDI